MNLGSAELNIGDSIEYFRNNSDKRRHLKPQRGVIISLTSTLITFVLGKDRDSISIQDIACGEVDIPGLPKISLTTAEVNAPYRNPLKAILS